MNNPREILKNLKLFHDLPDHELEKVASICRHEEFQPGQVVFREGDQAQKFYVVIEGMVEVWKNYGLPSQDILAIKGAGEPFGEMALIDDLPRSATLVAVEGTTCLTQEKEDFQKLLLENSSITMTLMRTVSAMVRQSNESFIFGLRKKNLKLEQAYQDLKKAQEELVRTERLTTLGKFASMVIHDLRNPISILKGYAEMITLSSDSSDKIKKFSGKIIDEAGRLSRMAGELLDFSRGDIRLNLSPTTAQQLLERVRENIQESFKAKGLEIVIENTVVDAVLLDFDRMLRAFINLSDNAKKAMKRGGTLTLGATEIEGVVTFMIQDTGVGMSQEVLNKIFDPFYSQSAEGGTGLGMLVVSNVIEAHQGTLDVKSEVGLGTKVLITMPKTPII